MDGANNYQFQIQMPQDLNSTGSEVSQMVSEINLSDSSTNEENSFQGIKTFYPNAQLYYQTDQMKNAATYCEFIYFTQNKKIKIFCFIN